MRVSLFGLFLRCTSLMEPWPKLVQSVLLVIGFYIGFPVLSWLCYACSYLLYLYSNPPVFCTRYHCYIHTCAHPGSPPGFYFTTRLGSFIWLPWILMSRSWSLELEDPSCWGQRLLLWSCQISCSSSPILAPPGWLAISPAISWALFCTVHICTSFWYSRICAYRVM